MRYYKGNLGITCHLLPFFLPGGGYLSQFTFRVVKFTRDIYYLLVVMAV